MKIAVDFDHTLLRSQDLIIKIRESLGVPFEIFMNTYSKVKPYKIEKHANEIVKLMPLDFNYLINELSKYYTLAPRFLYPDAIPFLMKLKEMGHKVDIVSKGDMNHQAKTIVSSGVHEYVNKVFVVEDKNFKNGYSIVVGDSEPDYTLAKANNAKLIRVKRGKYKDTEFPADYVVNDLYEALEVVKNL